MDYVKLMENGRTFIKNKQYLAGEEAFKKVIADLEEDSKTVEVLSEAYNNLGFIYYKKVEFNKAVEYYDKSINLNPSYGIAYYNRGTIHYRLGFYEKAVKDMEKAVKYEPSNVEFRDGLHESISALQNAKEILSTLLDS